MLDRIWFVARVFVHRSEICSASCRHSDHFLSLSAILVAMLPVLFSMFVQVPLPLNVSLSSPLALPLFLTSTGDR